MLDHDGSENDICLLYSDGPNALKDGKPGKNWRF